MFRPANNNAPAPFNFSLAPRYADDMSPEYYARLNSEILLLCEALEVHGYHNTQIAHALLSSANTRIEQGEPEVAERFYKRCWSIFRRKAITLTENLTAVPR